jgi:tyrosine-protein kinase Etk/Wzc
MKRPLYDPNERIFTLSDIKKLFRSQKKKIFRASYLGALLAFGYVLIFSVPKYEIVATFKESRKSAVDVKGLEKLHIGREGPASQTAVLIQSNQVLKPLVQRMGSQASVQRGSSLSRVYKRIRDNLLSESAMQLRDIDEFAFRRVVYEGEKKLFCSLRFEDPEQFSILSGEKIVATGTVGSPVHFEDAEFTIVKTPKQLKIGKSYLLSIQPWAAAVKAIRSQFRIGSVKSHESIFELRYFHRDRYFGAELLNALMEEYQKYLQKDHDQAVQEQLAYLQKRQGEICGKMSSVFDEYAEYLQSNLKESGQLGFTQEVSSASKECNALSNKIFSIDLELDRLVRMEADEKAFVPLDDTSFSRALKDTLNTISDLKLERDSIELSFPKTHCRAFNELKHENELFSLQEKIVQEQIQDTPCSFKGFDLTTVRTLLVDYCKKLDKISEEMSNFSRLASELSESDFEISSLSAALLDPLSQRLIVEASEIALKLKDEKHRTTKEGNRWAEELSLKKKILKKHLDQLYKIEQVKFDLVQDRMSSLQAIKLGSISGEISVLQASLADSIKERKTALLKEKKILSEKMKKFLDGLSDIPDRWRKEKWLNLKTQMAIKMVQGLTELVEAKTISSHLEHVESKPLDLATNPAVSCSPRLFLKAFFGAFLAGFAVFSRSFLRIVLKGFPSSNEKLCAMQYPVLGEISTFCDGPRVEPLQASDLDALRQIFLFLDKIPLERKVVGIIGGIGPDYSFALAEHFSRMSLSTVVIRCDFNVQFSAEDLPGLLQVWKKVPSVCDIPLRKRQGYDYIPSGGYTPYGTEVIRSVAFKELLEKLKKDYNFVLMVLRGPLNSAGSLAPLSLCDSAIVTVSGEPTEQLTPFVDWAYHENMCRLAFLTSVSP